VGATEVAARWHSELRPQVRSGCRGSERDGYSAGEEQLRHAGEGEKEGRRVRRVGEANRR
jgi:hypothetical protein